MMCPKCGKENEKRLSVQQQGRCVKFASEVPKIVTMEIARIIL